MAQTYGVLVPEDICDGGGDWHLNSSLKSIVVEIPKMNLLQRIWKVSNPDYIPDGSIETRTYFCSSCHKHQFKTRTLTKNIIEMEKMYTKRWNLPKEKIIYKERRY